MLNCSAVSGIVVAAGAVADVDVADVDVAAPAGAVADVDVDVAAVVVVVAVDNSVEIAATLASAAADELSAGKGDLFELEFRQHNPNETKE